MNCQDLISKLQTERKQLLDYQLYKKIDDPADLQFFMQYHVFAVWDFMSLLKALQREITCVEIPWFPKGNPSYRYLINEIVLAEETDLNYYGNRQSHFEMYHDAMKKADASTQLIDNFLHDLSSKHDVLKVIENSNLPHCVKQFLNFTFKTIQEGKSHKIAAIFTFGREELIPDMFTSIIQQIQQKFPEEDLKLFSYYFERHIELDGDEHGDMAMELVGELCGQDLQKWDEAYEISKEALIVRKRLWDGIAEMLESNQVSV